MFRPLPDEANVAVFLGVGDTEALSAHDHEDWEHVNVGAARPVRELVGHLSYGASFCESAAGAASARGIDEASSVAACYDLTPAEAAVSGSALGVSLQPLRRHAQRR